METSQKIETLSFETPKSAGDLFNILSDEQNIIEIQNLFESEFDKVFEGYKGEGFVESKTHGALTYNGVALLDAEVSHKLFIEARETLDNCLRKIVGADIMNRLSMTFLEKVSYTIGIEKKRHDADPFIDDNFERWKLCNRTIGLFSNGRTEYNNIEFVYTIFPNSIIEGLRKISKQT